jgi:hypothetical protein
MAQMTLVGLVAEESFAGYSDGFINGQDTDSTTGFAGTETWSGTSSLSSRGFNAASTGGLSYPLLPNSGGKAVAYRTSTFNDTNTNTVTLTSVTPVSNITNTELFFSFLINADDYTLRAGDTAGHGVTVSFKHGTTGGAPNIGVFFGGTTGELGINYRDTTSNSIQMTGLSLQSGTNLVVLGINAHSANPNATYSMWLNPDISTVASIGSGDYNFDTSFGVVTEHNSFGFYGWALQQRFNGIQTVDIDELRVGTSFEDVAPVPEPATYAIMLGLVGLGLAIYRRRR